MKNLEIMIFKFIIKSYKLIKHILYKIFIFPFQVIAWLTLRFWHKNLHGWRRYYKVIYYDKILSYFGMILVLLCMLKHTHYILYEPLAYNYIVHWPKRIESLRLFALVHWISCMFVYTVLYLVSWIFWQVHYYFKQYGQTTYFDFWLWWMNDLIQMSLLILKFF